MNVHTDRRTEGRTDEFRLNTDNEMQMFIQHQIIKGIHFVTIMAKCFRGNEMKTFIRQCLTLFFFSTLTVEETTGEISFTKSGTMTKKQHEWLENFSFVLWNIFNVLMDVPAEASDDFFDSSSLKFHHIIIVSELAQLNVSFYLGLLM